MLWSFQSNSKRTKRREQKKLNSPTYNAETKTSLWLCSSTEKNNREAASKDKVEPGIFLEINKCSKKNYEGKPSLPTAKEKEKKNGALNSLN